LVNSRTTRTASGYLTVSAGLKKKKVPLSQKELIYIQIYYKMSSGAKNEEKYFIS
jgi:hypothetical protein